MAASSPQSDGQLNRPDPLADRKDPLAEFLQPATQPSAASSGGQEHRRPEYGDWDPRATPATYVLLAINIAVYLWMGLHGASWTSPSPEILVRYGANFAPSELYDGQWYRLLTATFIHIGFLHIASNMWCLWNLGMLGEPLIGPWGLAAVYVLTGVAGNLLSVAVYVFWNHDLSVGAGASGAVFGITGILIVLLSNQRLPIPWSELKRLRGSVIRFALINLVIGASTAVPGLDRFGRIDNSAHIGGFLCGLALGPALVPRMTAGKERYLSRQKLVFGVAALVLSLFGYWISSVNGPVPSN